MHKFDIVWKRQDKNGKAHWEQCGVLVLDNHKISIKLDLIPVGEWDGWLHAYPRDQKSKSSL